MTCKINCLFLPYHNTGGHFIDWSIRYISGQTVTKVGDFHTQKNWRQHKSIKTWGYDQFVHKVNDLKISSTKNFENIYISMLTVNDAAKQLFGVNFEDATVEQREIAEQFSINDYKKIFIWCQDQEIVPIIFDYYSGDFYSMFYNNRHILDWNGNAQDNLEQFTDLYAQTFFNSMPTFGSDIWDKREQLALILKFPTPVHNLNNLYDITLPHLYYNTDDVWNNFNECMEEIVTILDINTDVERINSWQEIYKNWRTVHAPSFSRNIDKIVDSIVQNKYMSLYRYKLDFFMEIMIQQLLIKKYNLNLKTWELTKFPNNTQDLHKLLEPNIHNA